MPFSCLRLMMCLAILAAGALPASGDVKYYSSDADNGEPTDVRRFSLGTAAPPLTETPDQLNGHHRLIDDGTGTVTLDDFSLSNNAIINVGPEVITIQFGPGAFVFIQSGHTWFLSNPTQSNSSGVGAHGPSGTGPGESAEWGVVSGFAVTGRDFCVSSPVTICTQADFAHGETAPYVLPSDTYDLGTWNFDAVGDLDASWYIERTTNGGLTNVQHRIQGAFHGASLPALPLVGLGAAAVALLSTGARTLRGRRR